jgi:hypothetical protein
MVQAPGERRERGNVGNLTLLDKSHPHAGAPN